MNKIWRKCTIRNNNSHLRKTINNLILKNKKKRNGKFNGLKDCRIKNIIKNIKNSLYLNIKIIQALALHSIKRILTIFNNLFVQLIIIILNQYLWILTKKINIITNFQTITKRWSRSNNTTIKQNKSQL